MVVDREMDIEMQSTVVRDRIWRTSLVGRGSRTVILETGLGAESEDWSSVEREIASLASVFRYDRAGRGGSDGPLATRDAVEMIGAGSFLREPPMQRADRERLHGLWLQLQRSFLELSPRASRTFEPASGHFMQRDAPMAIVAAIRELCLA